MPLRKFVSRQQLFGEFVFPMATPLTSAILFPKGQIFFVLFMLLYQQLSLVQILLALLETLPVDNMPGGWVRRVIVVSHRRLFWYDFVQYVT
jgi:hypothetical protein